LHLISSNKKIKIMKYVLTGSTGHTSKPLAQQLIAAGHAVTIITSNNTKKAEIEALGATAAIGSVEDSSFIHNTFAGADGVYLMIPPNWAVTDWLGYQQKVADIYTEAVKNGGVKYVVVLSSVGAHMKQGAGPVDGLGYLEDKLAALTETNIRFLRPSYFYYNLFSMIPLIKHMGIVSSMQPAGHKLVLTHTSDIVDSAAQLLINPSFTGHAVQYIASDDNHTWADITAKLSEAVGKPGTPYVESSDEQAKAGMLQSGVSEVIANGYVAMGGALRSGEMEADYWKNKPAELGKVKLDDFAKEFAAAYNAG
jgi:uncharacterized protein YbjT (DUF2867 family)